MSYHANHRVQKRCFIIAEAGVNHNGDLEKALDLVDVASDAGADAVKFQTFKAEQVVTAKGEMALYQKRNTKQMLSQQEMLRKLELKEQFYKPIIDRCKKKHILFLSTPHGGRQSVDFLEFLNVSIYKVGSGDLTNYILLQRIAKTKKPVILSSGMATLQEIKDAIHFMEKIQSGPVSVLHCTTNYPCSLEDVNLAAMITMKKTLHVPIGYSDHTEGIQTAIMAVTLGASIYECHFTLDKTLPGPDHKASANPEELKARIAAIRNIEVIMGSSQKKPTKEEKLFMRKSVRRSIVASHDLMKGTVIKESDLEAKRPGNGVSPIYFYQFLHKKLVRSVKKDALLRFSYCKKK